ncbi:hypothetical protein [Mesorhizobium sp.]|uniref:hypothetical protein n=1 Tax=Mesorhizobium sp. TaxID=1871066 RepID=UPI00257BA650|nr:hypothetical protein [Mesorhizobium sp.]
MKHALVFDELITAITQPRRDWRRLAHAVALDLGGKLVMGLAIGLGVGLGMAIAG